MNDVTYEYLNQINKNPYLNQFRQVVREAEGTTKAVNPYKVKYGGELMKDYTEAFTPKEFTYTDKSGKTRKDITTATGDGQYTKSTIVDLDKRYPHLGLMEKIKTEGFTPEIQDNVFALIAHDRGFLTYLQPNNLDLNGLINKAKGTWASFPNAGYGQKGEKSAEKFNQILAKYFPEYNPKFTTNDGKTAQIITEHGNHLMGETQKENQLINEIISKQNNPNTSNQAKVIASLITNGSLLNPKAMSDAINKHDNIADIDGILDNFINKII